MQEDDLNCNICFRMAKDAFECVQAKCHKLYCKACFDHIINQSKKTDKEAKCPFCRTDKFKVRESPLRSKINNKPIKCRFCFQNWKFQEILKHERDCDQKKLKCSICSKVVKKKELVGHTKTAHKQKIDKIIQQSHTGKYPLIEPQLVIEKESCNFKSFEKPRLGTTGKFYCGADLEPPKCNCCNGKCGPTNGQNCMKCMRLDMGRRGLPKGYLVHGNGQMCWLDQNQHFSCGLMFSEERRTCGVEGYCKWCRNIQITVKRYEPLL